MSLFSEAIYRMYSGAIPFILLKDFTAMVSVAQDEEKRD